MAEAVLFGDLEAVAVAWLNPLLDPVKVRTEVPNPRPDELVKITLTGGSDPDIVSRWSQLTFECWALESDRASEICRRVAAYVRAIEGETVAGVFVRKVRTVGAPVSFPDPDTALPRYQVTLELNHRYSGVL